MLFDSRLKNMEDGMRLIKIPKARMPQMRFIQSWRGGLIINERLFLKDNKSCIRLSILSMV